MVTKLKLALKNLHWQLIFRSLIWGLSLLWYWESGFGRFSLLVFLIFSIWLYIQPIFQTIDFATIFVGLIIISPLVVARLITLGQVLVATGFLTGIFYIILALKNLYIIKRFRWYLLINLSVYYLFLLILFLSDPSYLFWLKSIILFLITVFLTKELLRVATKHGELLASLEIEKMISPFLLGFLMFQVFWVVGFLQTGFINGATISLLLFFSLIIILFDYLRFQFLEKKTFWELISIVALIFLILLSNKWVP